MNIFYYKLHDEKDGNEDDASVKTEKMVGGDVGMRQFGNQEQIHLRRLFNINKFLFKHI